MLPLEAQNRIRQFNPWLVNPEQARELIDRFPPPVYVVREGEEVSLVENRALLVVGPRQSGKSTMIWHRLRDFAPLKVGNTKINFLTPLTFVDWLAEFSSRSFES